MNNCPSNTKSPATKISSLVLGVSRSKFNCVFCPSVSALTVNFPVPPSPGDTALPSPPPPPPRHPPTNPKKKKGIPPQFLGFPFLPFLRIAVHVHPPPAQRQFLPPLHPQTPPRIPPDPPPTLH